MAGTAWRTARAASCSRACRTRYRRRPRGRPAVVGPGFQTRHRSLVSLLACRIWSRTPRASAAACRSLNCESAVGLVGLTRTAITVAAGTASCSIFQPLWRYLHVQARHACKVTSRPVQALDKSNCDWIGTHLEDYWDCCGRRLCRERCGSASWRDNHGHLTTYQICRQRRQSIVLTFRPAKFDRDISTLDIAGFARDLGGRLLHGLTNTAGDSGRDIRSPASPAAAPAPRAATPPPRRRAA